MTGKESPPNLLAEALERAAQALSGNGSYALIGGLAVAYHGLPRPTRDIDLLLCLPRVALPALLEKFHDRGFTFDTEQVVRQLGEDHLSRVHYAGIRVDLLDAAIPLFRATVERAREDNILGQRLRIAAAEDLIALKMIAGREDDLRDIRGILATQGERLDLTIIRSSLEECCEPERLEVFSRLVEEEKGKAP